VANTKTTCRAFLGQCSAVSKHLKNIFETGELEENSVVSKMETTALDGKKYKTNFSSFPRSPWECILQQ
jgi:hypothetical protein